MDKSVLENKRVEILPKDQKEWLDLRTKDITSTDVAALFGLSPWISPYELWHVKKNSNAIEAIVSEPMKWGNRLQNSIAHGIAEDYNLNIRPMKEYIRVPDLRIGSSFDFAIAEDGILEVKNVNYIGYKEGWISDAVRLEAPAHIELQVQHQLLVSDRDYAMIGTLVGGNKVCVIKRERDPYVHKLIRETVESFWKSIDDNRAPEPNFKRDAKFIAKLNGYAEAGKVLDATGDDTIKVLVKDYKEWSAKEASAKAEKEGIKAQLLTLIEDAEKVFGDNFSIRAGLVPSTTIETYVRKSFRDFKIYMKKEPANDER